MKNIKLSHLFLVFVGLALLIVIPVKAQNISTQLKGKILLQVEQRGEAWYVNPDNSKKYYLGRPVDAIKVMRDVGLGVSNRDFQSFGDKAPTRLAGKILLKVEDGGKAFYVNPENLEMHFLGRPRDALKVMKDQGLGITDDNLSKIEEDESTTSLHEALPQDDTATPVEALDTTDDDYGKPGMEDGTGQVVRPDSCGNKNVKLYLCKISCGEDIINNCNGYSSTYLYQLNTCRGDCLSHNIFYGCGYEQGCDDPCWEDYDEECHPNVYNECIENCEEVHGDCHS